MSGAFRQSSAQAPDSSSLEDEDGQEGGANLSPLVVDAVGKALQAHFRAISDCLLLPFCKSIRLYGALQRAVA